MIRRPKNKKWRRRRLSKWGDRMFKLTGNYHVVYYGGVLYEICTDYIETTPSYFSGDWSTTEYTNEHL